MTITALGQVGINLPLDYIQTIRLCCAFLESDYTIHFPESAQPIFEYWNTQVPARYEVGLQGIPLLENITILHNQPLCKVGNLERPLIFPRAMLKLCRKKWSEQRPIQFLFCGLMTEKRKHCLETWVHSCFGRDDIAIATSDYEYSRLKRVWKQIKGLLGQSKTAYVLEDLGLQIFSSQKGREFPIKIWDEDYFNQLAQSQFVLCPDGDFTWTYRFFEAMLCGAIPLIENECDLYEGFQYYSMQDPIEKLIYSPEMAEHNYQRAWQFLTLEPAELNYIIQTTLDV
ncbi:MAG: hypothetical protein WCD18_03240 [Thermosynechococcaceae cyanobacterium]